MNPSTKGALTQIEQAEWQLDESLRNLDGACQDLARIRRADDLYMKGNSLREQLLVFRGAVLAAKKREGMSVDTEREP